MHAGKKFFFYAFISLAFLSLSGCQTLAEKEKARELVEFKKKNFRALRQNILSRKIHDGITSDKIKEQYGAPDDVFFSGSNTSRFEIWTYEFITTSTEEREENPIRLYFANNKLINFSY